MFRGYHCNRGGFGRGHMTRLRLGSSYSQGHADRGFYNAEQLQAYQPQLEQLLSDIQTSGRGVLLQEEVEDVRFYLDIVKDAESCGDQLETHINRIEDLTRRIRRVVPLTDKPIMTTNSRPVAGPDVNDDEPDNTGGGRNSDGARDIYETDPLSDDSNSGSVTPTPTNENINLDEWGRPNSYGRMSGGRGERLWNEEPFNGPQGLGRGMGRGRMEGFPGNTYQPHAHHISTPLVIYPHPPLPPPHPMYVIPQCAVPFVNDGVGCIAPSSDWVKNPLYSPPVGPTAEEIFVNVDVGCTPPMGPTAEEIGIGAQYFPSEPGPPMLNYGSRPVNYQPPSIGKYHQSEASTNNYGYPLPSQTGRFLRDRNCMTDHDETYSSDFPHDSELSPEELRSIAKHKAKSCFKRFPTNERRPADILQIPSKPKPTSSTAKATTGQQNVRRNKIDEERKRTLERVQGRLKESAKPYRKPSKLQEIRQQFEKQTMYKLGEQGKKEGITETVPWRAAGSSEPLSKYGEDQSYSNEGDLESDPDKYIRGKRKRRPKTGNKKNEMDTRPQKGPGKSNTKPKKLPKPSFRNPSLGSIKNSGRSASFDRNKLKIKFKVSRRAQLNQSKTQAKSGSKNSGPTPSTSSNPAPMEALRQFVYTHGDPADVETILENPALLKYVLSDIMATEEGNDETQSMGGQTDTDSSESTKTSSSTLADGRSSKVARKANRYVRFKGIRSSQRLARKSTCASNKRKRPFGQSTEKEKPETATRPQTPTTFENMSAEQNEILRSDGALQNNAKDASRRKVEMAKTILNRYKRSKKIATADTFVNQGIGKIKLESDFSPTVKSDPDIMDHPIPEDGDLFTTFDQSTHELETEGQSANEPVTDEQLTREPVTDEQLTSEPVTDEQLTNEPVTDDKSNGDGAFADLNGETKEHLSQTGATGIQDSDEEFDTVIVDYEVMLD